MKLFSKLFGTFLAVALIISVIFVLASCNPDDGKVSDTTTVESVTTQAEAATTVAETTITEETTPENVTTAADETTVEVETTQAETELETLAFNEGRVTYEKKVTRVTTDAYPDDKMSEVMSPTDKTVVTLFDQSFNTSDPNCGGKAVSREEGKTGVTDGKLVIPYDSQTGGLGGGWTTWCPNVESSFKDYKQIQLSADIEILNGQSVTATGLIGCYVSNYTFSIADNYGDGIWLAFLKDSSEIAVLGSDRAHWPWSSNKGNVSVKVPGNALASQFSVDIVCTNDLSTFVYINSSLALSITIADSKITVFDAGGNQVYQEKYNMEAAAGSNFSLFCHGGGFMVDDMQIYGGSVGKTTETCDITATPVNGEKLGLDITNKQDLVSICYTMWFNAIHGNGDSELTDVLNVSELQAQYGFNSSTGFGKGHNAMTRFHYWAEPAQGYYRSTDKQAARNNMTLLYNAGVDFLILDYTYAVRDYKPGTSAWKTYIDGPMNTLLDTIMEMRAEGLGTPYVVMWIRDSSLFDDVYEHFYSVEKWKDCFVYWNDKPFILEWNFETLETDNFTVRAMYGLQGRTSRGQWSYLEVNNTKSLCKDADGNYEHMCACVATQESYMSESSAHGRDGGNFWYKQWKNVFNKHPKIVTVTWWNEWCAQLYNVGTAENPHYIFTDNFNQEYSRDIEPMKGGHGDQYYQWLCQYIKAYKNNEECPELVEK